MSPGSTPLRSRVRRLLRANRAKLVRSSFGRLAAHGTGRRILHCFGDSHTGAFREISRASLLRRTWLDVHAIRGATALGILNPRSSTNALGRFRDVIRRLPAGESLLFQLGEVDCGYLIWHRSKRLGISIDEQLEETIGNYTAFLQGLIAEGRRSIIVSAVSPPTILDNQSRGAITEARMEANVSIQDRTMLTRAYNERLREWATLNGCGFLDFEEEVLDPATGLVRDDLRPSSPADPHLDRKRFAPILARHLTELGYR